LAVTYANTKPNALVDGLVYSAAKSLPATEADIFNGPGLDPIPTIYNSAILAVVKFTISGGPATNSAYVTMQSSVDGGVTWFDIAGCLCTALSGSVTFAISCGSAGSLAVQQTRANGTAPSTSGANQLPLGGVVRFTGQQTLTGGTNPAVKVDISYKLLPLS
jgi:hypothetical protein